MATDTDKHEPTQSPEEYTGLTDTSFAASNEAPAEVPKPAAPVPADRTRLSKRWILGVAVLAIVLIAVVTALAAHGNQHQAYNENATINTNEYQAVFLTNGQVYFGKLADLNHHYVSIANIYYLQVQQNLQAGNGGNTTDGSQVSLAKLGSELHGPEDHMQISSDQILFWENMKNDSKVTQAITKYQSQN